LKIEITNISTNGLWMLIDEVEFFLSYDDFPWFKNQTINDISQVETFGESSIYFPKLDIDLNVAMIKNPQKYPLISADRL
jgi:hypothetical protein